MFELLFAFLLLFAVIKITFALGFGLLRIILGFVGLILVVALIPVSFALFLPLTIGALILVGFVTVLQALFH
jgi:hypothetical protein